MWKCLKSVNGNNLMLKNVKFLIAIGFICLQILPRCTQSQKVFIIDDEATPGRSLGNVVDGNSVQFELTDILEYRIAKSNDPGVDRFSVDAKTGALMVVKRIDRDTLCIKEFCLIKLQIIVKFLEKSSGNPPGKPPGIEIKMLDVTINVTDINDNSPVFPQTTQHIRIPESAKVGSRFPLQLAIDPDSLPNSVRKYEAKVESYNEASENTIWHMFKLVTEPTEFSYPSPPRHITGLFLEVLKPLDRETKDLYSFVITASDSVYNNDKSKSGTATVSVTITDINDNGPKFDHVQYSFTVDEGKSDSINPLVSVKATDIDHGINAQVLYDFGPPIHYPERIGINAKEYFNLDSQSGNIYLVKPLDYELEPKPEFTVIAKDANGHSETATVTVSGTVNNLNDEKPVITIDYLNDKNYTNIMENLLDHTTVALVTATDRDHGDHGQVNCRLVSHTSYINLEKIDKPESDQYRVIIHKPLDRETEAHMKVRIVCKDIGPLQNSAEAVINIIVDDENDNSPILKLKGGNVISENIPSDITVCEIIATDKDYGMNSKVSFSIDQSPKITQNMLRIDENGVIWTKETIDRESTDPPLDSLNVTVVVTDQGKPSRSSIFTMTINIKDVNDNSPIFSPSVMEFNFPENQPPNSQIDEIYVTDADKDEMLTVSIEPDYSHGSHMRPFIIVRKQNKNGKEKPRFFLHTTESLDAEKKQSYEFRVKASDGQGRRDHTTFASITVKVINENDNSPKIIFPKNNSTLSVSYHEYKGHVIFTVNANDADNKNQDSSLGHFIFELTETSPDGDKDLSTNNDVSQNNLFTIDAIKGAVSPIRTMTTNDIGDHWVTISVSDHGIPKKTDSVRCLIKVDTSKPKERNRGTENQQYELNYGDIWREDLTLIFILVVVLILLLGVIILFVYVRHWRNAFKFFPDLLLICNGKRSQEESRENGDGGGEEKVGHVTAGGEMICADLYGSRMCGAVVGQDELIKLEKQEQNRRKLYSEYYMATGRPSSRTLPYKNINYETVDISKTQPHVIPGQSQIYHEINDSGISTMKRGDPRQYDLLLSPHRQRYMPSAPGTTRIADPRRPQMLPAHLRDPNQHFYQTLAYEEARNASAHAIQPSHGHQRSTLSERQVKLIDPFYEENEPSDNLHTQHRGQPSPLRNSSNFKSDPLLNWNSASGHKLNDASSGETKGRGTKQFHDMSPHGNKPFPDDIPLGKRLGSQTLGKVVRDGDRYATGQVVFGCDHRAGFVSSPEGDDYAVSFPRVQASFV